MPAETHLQLLKAFAQFLWLLNGAIAILLLLVFGLIAWLCYAERRSPNTNQ